MARKQKWTRERIIAALRKRQARGLPVNDRAVRAGNCSLRGAIRSRFGSHDAALRAADIDPAAVRLWDRKWDQETITAALRDRHAKGLAVNVRDVEASALSLRRAIQRHFESHDAALRAAGIDPNTVRRRQPPRDAPRDRASIIRALQGRHARGEAMNSVAIQRSEPWLIFPMKRYWGLTSAALRAAGIDPDTVRQRGRKWDKATIAAALRDRQANGLPVNSRAVSDSDAALAGAINRYYASFDEALQAAGIDLTAARVMPPPLDRQGVLDALRQRHAAGLRMTSEAISESNSPLTYGIYKFGSSPY